MYTNTAEQSPLRNFLQNESLWWSSDQWLMFNMSVIASGLIVLYIESLTSAILCLLLIRPKKTFRQIYTVIWFVLMLIVPNVAQGICMHSEFNVTPDWRNRERVDPLEAFHVYTAIGASLVSFVYFISILLLTCILPLACRKGQKDGNLRLQKVIFRLFLVSFYGFVLQFCLMPYQCMNISDFVLSYYKGLVYKLMGQIELSRPDELRITLINWFLRYISWRDYFILYTPPIVCLLSFICFPLYPKKIFRLSRRAYVYTRSRSQIAPKIPLDDDPEIPPNRKSSAKKKSSIVAQVQETD